MLNALLLTLALQQQPRLPEPPKALIQAAEKGEVPKVAGFAQDAAFANPNKNGLTALTAAGLKGQKLAFAEIIAIVNLRVKQQFTDLPKAGQPGVVPAMQAMSDRERLFKTADKNGMTPLMLAASHGWDDLVQSLLDGGADKASIDKNGKSAADHAVAAGFKSLAETLKK
jgi:ankyrin repeat protein